MAVSGRSNRYCCGLRSHDITNAIWRRFLAKWNLNDLGDKTITYLLGFDADRHDSAMCRYCSVEIELEQILADARIDWSSPRRLRNAHLRSFLFQHGPGGLESQIVCRREAFRFVVFFERHLGMVLKRDCW